MTTRANDTQRATTTYTPISDVPDAPLEPMARADHHVAATMPARGTLSPTFPPRAPSPRWSSGEELFVRMRQGCQH